MTDRGKLKRPLGSTRKWSIESEDHPSYEEQRGLRRLTFDLEGKRPEAAAALAKKMIDAATQVIADAGEKSIATILAEADAAATRSADQALDEALAIWSAGITLKHGFFSPISSAARLLGHNAALTRSMAAVIMAEEQCSADDVAAEDQEVRMRQIYEFADAWHWLHMELFGEHELAFAKRDGAAKGAAAMAEKGKRKNQIIADAIEAVRSKGLVNMANHSAVAKAIQAEVDEKCAKAGLEKAQSSQSFIKSVAAVLKSGKG
ncbi:hypothetical protein [Bradyrhizobium canariense]|uniref:Uncharacterized protein n=1 Tax=Bradyrhizobium canariense TaxID=255045 RepID=A0A1X3H8Q8_9BRAD|nr:hypothetical protein [Bradyrhizobium canariense]OSI68877.1 hypothetical protein BSZ22_19825 [Bradyrhizobium canariense]OSI79411.1 hypothetical protein BSZ23_15115 [Bradyrhizobium canariense]OSI89591.1 hypothetical protein BSZ25_20285 [Bradyrhizobium canariense]OSI91031.1 hypothetical protein BSZ24_18920 [Bradyrhizobium canariense]OSJ03957.1 hypothetical protein BSZ16_14720 [Bradyrhizobium canariense]